MSIDYKYKIEKYKNKYFNLINQNGGKPIKYEQFIDEFNNIDKLIGNQQHILTGTGAIICMLFHYNMTELLDNFLEINDCPTNINYLYTPDNANYLNINKIGNFDKSDELSNDKITCYLNLNVNDSNKIKKICFTKVHHIEYSKLGDYDIVNINSLYNMYLFNDGDKVEKQNKINTIEQIMFKIKNDVKKNNNHSNDDTTNDYNLNINNSNNNDGDTLSSLFK